MSERMKMLIYAPISHVALASGDSSDHSVWLHADHLVMASKPRDTEKIYK